MVGPTITELIDTETLQVINDFFTCYHRPHVWRPSELWPLLRTFRSAAVQALVSARWLVRTSASTYIFATAVDSKTPNNGKKGNDMTCVQRFRKLSSSCSQIAGANDQMRTLLAQVNLELGRQPVPSASRRIQKILLNTGKARGSRIHCARRYRIWASAHQ